MSLRQHRTNWQDCWNRDLHVYQIQHFEYFELELLRTGRNYNIGLPYTIITLPKQNVDNERSTCTKQLISLMKRQLDWFLAGWEHQLNECLPLQITRLVHVLLVPDKLWPFLMWTLHDYFVPGDINKNLWLKKWICHLPQIAIVCTNMCWANHKLNQSM